MGLAIKDQDLIKEAKKIHVNIEGTWNAGKKGFVNINGNWLQFWANTNVGFTGWAYQETNGGLSASAMVVVGDYLYIFGGKSAYGSVMGDYTRVAFKVDLNSGTVTRMSDLPNPLGESIGYYNSTDGLIYLFFISSPDSLGSRFWYSYNLNTDTYTEIMHDNSTYSSLHGLGQDMITGNGMNVDTCWLLNGRYNHDSSVYRVFRQHKYDGTSTLYANIDESNYAMLVAPITSGDVYAFNSIGADGQLFYYKWDHLSNTWSNLGNVPWPHNDYSSMGCQGKAIQGKDGKIYIVIRKNNKSFSIYSFDPASNTFSLMFDVQHQDQSFVTTGFSPTMQHDFNRNCFWILSAEVISENRSYKNNIYRFDY